MQPGQILVNKYGTREKLIDTTDKAAAFEKDSGELVWYSKSKLLENGWSLLEEPWVPMLAEPYWYVDEDGNFGKTNWGIDGMGEHDFRYSIGNVHQNLSGAKLYRQKLIERMGRKEN